MAKVQFGGGIAGLSGKLAGNVFARNKGGAYVRNWVKPVNPNTVLQQQARDRVATYSQEWRQLSEEQQAAWAEYAASHPVLDRLGAAIILTAAQAYVKINTNRDMAGDTTPNDEVPGDPAFATGIFGANSAFLADVSDGEVNVPLGAGAVAGQIVALWMTPPVSAGVNNAGPQMRQLQVYTLLAGDITATELLVGELYEARFGLLDGNAGRKIIFEGTEYSEGQFSVPSRLTTIIQA